MQNECDPIEAENNAAAQSDILAIAVLNVAPTEIALSGDASLAARLLPGANVMSCTTVIPEFASERLSGDAPQWNGPSRRASCCKVRLAAASAGGERINPSISPSAMPFPGQPRTRVQTALIRSVTSLGRLSRLIGYESSDPGYRRH